MSIKSFFRKIALFPLAILMGIPDTEGGEAVSDKPLGERIMQFAGNPNAQFAQIPDAAASEDDDQGADPDGKPGGDDETGGLDTTSDEDGQDADLGEGDDEDADNPNGQEANETEEGKGTKKRTLEERAAEIAAKIVEEKLAEREQAARANEPNFIIIDQEKVDAWISETEAKIDELRLEGNYREARKLSREIDQVEKDLEENERRKQEYIQRQASTRHELDQGTAERKALDETAELYRSEMKIDPKAWETMGAWFEEKVRSDKLLNQEFNDIYQRKGKVAAIRFAHEYTVEHMGQKAKQANEQREQGKRTASGLTTATTGKASPEALKKAQAAFAKNPSDENFVALQAAKRQARGQ